MPTRARLLVSSAGLLAVLVAAAVAAVSGLPPLPATIVPAIACAAVWFGWDRRAELRRRRKEAGLCEHCAYDLTGNVSGVCPECGRTWRARMTAPARTRTNGSAS